MRLRDQLLTSLLLMPLAGTSAWAKERANFDAFLSHQQTQALSVSDASLQSRGFQVAHVEERLGLPTFLWSARAGTGTAQRGMARASQRPETAARAHLQQLADVYRLNRDDLSGAVLHSVHKTEHGPVVVRFTQKVDGIEVFRGGVSVAMDRHNELVAISGYLAPNEAVSARRRMAGTDFQLGAADAVARAFADLTDTKLSARSLVGIGAQGEFSHFAFEPGVGTVLPHAMATPARAQQVLFTMPDGLQPAWYVELHVGTKGSNDADYYSFVVSASNGSLLFRNNLTVEDSFTYKVWAEPGSFIPYDGPHGNDATPHPTGTDDRYQAPFVAPNTITLESVAGVNDPWLPPGATQTTGNNVEAYADLAAPDGFQPEGDLRANTTSANTFDYTYDVTQAPGASSEQRKAAITQLFYVNNFLHDSYYHAGFNEAAGNAQASNYGRGGLENDSLKVEAQDYSGRNNANMSTPADGSRPRMQMYVFDGVPSLQITAPSSVAGNKEAASAGWGKSVFDITGDVVIPNPSGVTEGCSPFPEGAFTGKIALLDRGTCGFTVKALNAQNAGAIAVLIANNTAKQPAPGLGGSDPAITIAALGVTQELGIALRSEVKANGTTISLKMKKSPDLDRDGTLDNAIVAHEWGHYISNRLVGNANGLINNQGRSMGEGWADFHAMMMIVREEDRRRDGTDDGRYQGVYAVAAYTQSGGANNGHYFGIRRVPYSTDSAKNSLRFRHFSIGSPLPTNHPVSSSFLNGVGNAQVHNGGEVWASMLWECYASLLAAHPFPEAQDRMKQYVVAGYKLTPNSPTLLEARDALLAAVAASDPADYQRFLNAFATRGAGLGAKGPDRDSVDHIGVVESYAHGNNLEVVSIRLDDSAAGCDRDGALDKGETGRLVLTVRNTGVGALQSFTAAVASTSTSATFAFPNGNTFTVPALQRGATATAFVNVSLTDVTPGTEPRAGMTVTLNEPSLPDSARTVKFNGRVHYDEVAYSGTTDTFETELSGWTSSPVNRWVPVVERNEDGTPSRYFHVANLPVVSNMAFTSPWMKVNATGDFVVNFKYRHSLEGTTSGSGVAAPFFDGVVLEVTTDGITWDNVFTKYQVNPGYTATLTASDNPLLTAPAYAGLSADFPAWATGTANFAQKLAGKEIRLRFRIGSDTGSSAYGFDLDDVAVTNATPPFTTLVAETSDGTSCNRRPVADVGPSPRPAQEFIKGVRSIVSLTGDGSFDPDGDPLTYKWEQISGPVVTLTNPTSAAPTFEANVSKNTVFGFRLTVNDGKEDSLPKILEIALAADRAPVAKAGPDREVLSGESVTIAGSATDPDNVPEEPITYAWTLVDAPEGTTVALTGANTATPSFTAPTVKRQPVALTFQLKASSNDLSSTDTVVITVKSTNRRPVGTGPTSFEEEEGTPITLDASGYTDPDGDPLLFKWTQTGGPLVDLTGATSSKLTFTTPEVSTDTLMTFVLVVQDEIGEEAPAVPVTLKVLQVNKAPVAHPRKLSGGISETLVTLDATTSSDPDGDALTYKWAQISGPTVALSSETAQTVTFAAPKVESTTRLRFELTVTDPAGVSSSETVDVLVLTDDEPAQSCSSTGNSAGGAMLLALLAGVLLSRRRGVLGA